MSGVGTPSLRATSHEHHERILSHVNRLPSLADDLGRADMADFQAQLAAECEFIATQLVPHIEAIELTVYGQLDHLMEQRHSMDPMRDEHARLRRLFDVLYGYRDAIERGDFGAEEAIGLRRVLYRLYGLLKVHLAEEEMYLAILERDLSDEDKLVLARGIDHAAAQPV